MILDGEIVAWGTTTEDGGHAHAVLAKSRSVWGAKQVSEKLIKEVPVAYVVFDVIYAGGELTLDQPLRERAQILDRVFAGGGGSRREPVINAQGNLLFEPEIDEQERVGMGASRARHARRLGRAAGAVTSRQAHGARQRRPDDQGPSTHRTCPGGAAAGG